VNLILGMTADVRTPVPRGLIILTAALLATACGPSRSRLDCGDVELGASAPTCAVRVIERYPHDPNAYTQGLVFHKGQLFEGTGLRGESSLRRVDLMTGEILEIRELPLEYFGEGIAIFENQILQLTLTSGTGFRYAIEGLEPIGTFNFAPEGWGLTQDGEQLILSDGSNVLRIIDPATNEVTRRIQVTDAGQPVRGLNELEFVHGELLANVWLTDRIAHISLQAGQVIAWLDLSGILGVEEPPGVLNGIAYDAAGDRLFVTGKNWPWLFEIEVVPAE
jgi:glutamine cyclotransferase